MLISRVRPDEASRSNMDLCRVVFRCYFPMDNSSGAGISQKKEKENGYGVSIVVFVDDRQNFSNAILSCNMYFRTIIYSLPMLSSHI